MINWIKISLNRFLSLKSMQVILLTIFISCVSTSVKANYATLEKVYLDITSAMGLLEYPKLVFDPFSENSVAHLSYSDHQIVFEKKAYDICASLGNRKLDAIALILGHELAHYKYGHNWGEEFATSFALFDIGVQAGKELDLMDNLAYWETQADQMGGIFAYLGGYYTLDISSELLDKLYSGYHFPENMEEYPSLSSRKEIAMRNIETVKEIISVFETGNLALTINEYDLAINCYESIIRKGLASREVFNNLGVAYTLAYIEFKGPSFVKYAYPVELDINSRIKSSRGGDRDSYANKAIFRFQQASLLDRDYIVALINLASIYAVSGQLEDAWYYAKKASRLSVKQDDLNAGNNAKLLLALLNDMEGDKKEAVRLLKGLKSKGHWLAAQNLQIINGQKIQEIAWTDQVFNTTGMDIDHSGKNIFYDGKEIIDEIHLGGGFFEISDYSIIEIGRDQLIHSNLFSSDFYYFEKANGDKLYFIKTGNSYSGKSGAGLTKGNSFEETISKYGLPEKIIPVRNGMIAVFSTPQILFLFGPENKLTHWWVYHTERQ